VVCLLLLCPFDACILYVSASLLSGRAYWAVLSLGGSLIELGRRYGTALYVDGVTADQYLLYKEHDYFGQLAAACGVRITEMRWWRPL
jgi:hypothetical protein